MSRVESEEKGGGSREVHFSLGKTAFYEFMTRFSRCVVCGSSTRNYISYNGQTPLAGLSSFTESELNSIDNTPRIDEATVDAADRLARLATFG